MDPCREISPPESPSACDPDMTAILVDSSSISPDENPSLVPSVEDPEEGIPVSDLKSINEDSPETIILTREADKPAPARSNTPPDNPTALPVRNVVLLPALKRTLPEEVELELESNEIDPDCAAELKPLDISRLPLF